MTAATNAVYFAAGHNNVAGYAIVPLQPTTVKPMILFTAKRYSLNDKRKDDGRFTRLAYPRITTTQFNTLVSFFGFTPLSGINEIDGTIHYPFDTGTYYDWNCTVRYIENGNPTQRTLGSWSQVEFLVVDMVKI